MNIEAVSALFDLVLRQYNQLRLAGIRNVWLSELSNHIDSNYQLVIKIVWKKKVRVKFVPIEEMVTNVITKNLSLQTFLPLRAMVGMR